MLTFLLCAYCFCSGACAYDAYIACWLHELESDRDTASPVRKLSMVIVITGSILVGPFIWCACAIYDLFTEREESDDATTPEP